MKIAHTLVLLAGLLAIPRQASAQEIDAAAAPAVAVVEAFGAALQAGDLGKVEALLDPGVLVLEGGGAERSRAEYFAGHAKADAEFLKGAHVQLLRRSAHAEGDMAWVGTESEIHATVDGKPKAYASTETMVLRKRDGAWRIVHIHWSSRAKAGAK